MATTNTKRFIAVDDNGTDKLVKVNGKIIEIDLGTSGSGTLDPADRTKIDNLPADTNAELQNKQESLGLDTLRNSNTGKDDVFKVEGNFSSKDVSGNRQVAVEPDHLVDKQYVDGQLLIKDSKIDANTADINLLSEQVQSIENTWKGSEAFSGTNPAEPEIDLKTLTGDKGAFDFTAGKKMLVKITLNNTLYSAEQLMRVGDHSSFHISGRKLDGGETTDVTFTLSLNTNGTLKMTDFHSTGTANHNAFFLRLELVEQNPKVVAVIDAYTKAETNTKLADKADKTSVYTKTESDGKYETKSDITTKLNDKADKTALATKQDTLTKTLTIEFSDGTTEDFKVG